MNIINITASSQVGCIRSNNEDMVLVVDKFLRNDILSTSIDHSKISRYVIGLADGMGGHNGGEVASEQTLRNLHFYINDLPCELSKCDFNEALLNWLDSINAIIESMGASDNELANMGTTLVALIYYNERFCWINCGDSRLYRFRDGKLMQLSNDHSLNIITGQPQHSNVVTNCIGGGCKTSFIDSCDITSDILPSDIYLLCSDGLSDMLSDDIISKLLKDSRITANDLCDAAIASGGLDNVSACLIKIS